MLGLRPDEKGIKPSYNFIAGGPMAAAPQNGVAALSQIRADRCYNKRSVKRQAMIVKRMPLPHEATRVSKDFGERRPRRARSSRRAVGAAAAQADQKAFEASFQQHYARVYNPVSYTHLRAHETVLDLVCRLLLEKNKNTHIKNHSSIHIKTSHPIDTTYKTKIAHTSY